MLFQRSPGRINIKLIGSCGKVKFSVPFHFGAVKMRPRPPIKYLSVKLFHILNSYSSSSFTFQRMFCLSDKTLHQKLQLSFIWAVQIVQNTHDFLDNGGC